MPRKSALFVLMFFLVPALPAQTFGLLGPPIDDGPVIVDIGFYLSDVNDISEDKETFEFEGILTMQWTDRRQAFDPAETGYQYKYYQGDFQFSEIFNGWWPQVYLANESGNYDRQAVSLRIAPDGRLTYVEELDATAESRMALRRYPFDSQSFEAIFEVLGFDKDEVIFRSDPELTGIWDDEHHRIRIPQWHPPVLTTTIREYDPNYGGAHHSTITAFVLQLEIERKPGHMLMLVIFPLTVLVILSWSVFWMNRSSLGDRMDISFIGILTVVAYQIMFSGQLPKISYLTILSAFLIISFLTICTSVVINLIVAHVDQKGDFSLGERIDRRCRMLFPAAYATLVTAVCAYLYLVEGTTH